MGFEPRSVHLERMFLSTSTLCGCILQGPWKVGAGEVIGWSGGGTCPLVNSCRGPARPVPSRGPLTGHNPTGAIARQSLLVSPGRDGLGEEGERPSP